MAAMNGEGSFIERHIEKFVLAVSAVLLIVVGLHWGLSSPHRVKLKAIGPGAGQVVCSPDEVCQKLQEMAERLDKSLRRARPKLEPIPDYTERLARIFSNPWNVNLDLRGYDIAFDAAPRPPKQEWKIRVKKVTPITLAELLPLPKPEKPEVKIVREVQVIPRQAPVGVAGVNQATPQYTYNEVDVAHVAGVFEFGKLLKHWQKVLEKVHQPARLIFVRVEARRRRLLPDGTWSDPVPVKMFTLPDAPVIPEIPTPDGKNFLEIMQATTLLASLEYQRYILEPPYYDIIWPDGSIGTWKIRNHKPQTRVSKLLMVEQPTVGPRGIRRARLEERPGRTFRIERGVERRELPRRSPTNIERRREKTIKKKRTPRRFEGPGTSLERGMNERSAGKTYPRGYRTSTPKVRKVTRPVRTARGNIERGRFVSRRGSASLERASPFERGAVERGAPEREMFAPRPLERARRTPFGRPGQRKRQVRPSQPLLVLPVPSLEEQLRNPAGILEVWFHDQTGLEEGLSYSYSFRLVVVNPVVGRFNLVKDKKDAEVVTLSTPWSDWSEPVPVKRPTEFFLVGHAPQIGTVEIDVFTQRWGQRVKSRFTVAAGEPIGADVPVELVRLDTGKPEKITVSFKTGAVAVDFDFNRKQRIPGTSFYRTTTEMLYLDARGDLRTRTEFEDKNSPRYKELLQEVNQAASSTVAGIEGRKRG